jgi:hypothetical protein
MSSNAARGSAAPAPDEAAIAAYLEKHPDFFERHPNALARLKLPHARGAAVSLIERQIEVLRDKHAAMEEKLSEFVRVARANDQLADKIHRFTRRLLRASSVASTLTELEASLREDFDAFNARLILIGPAEATLAEAGLERFLRSVSGDDPTLRSFDSLFESAKPRCGQVRDSQREFLFGADAGGIASVALVPLLSATAAGVVTPVGLLAVGSNESARFHPGMSTEFLARMGDLITDAVQRFR